MSEHLIRAVDHEPMGVYSNIKLSVYFRFKDFEVLTGIGYLTNRTGPVSRYRLKIEYMESPENIDLT